MTPSQPTIDTATLPNDDVVIVFRAERARVQGRLVRLGPVGDAIARAHNLPPSASLALGEALAVAALLGSVLSAEGETLSFQTRTDGSIPTIYADCRATGQLRGYVRASAADDAQSGRSPLGSGHLAVTHERAASDERYQGVIAIDGGSLAEATEAYFKTREAMPTLVRLACAELSPSGSGPASATPSWRAGGLLVQAQYGQSDDDEDWSRVRMLAATVEPHELLDPTLSTERLLLRLFHEEGVRIEKIVPLRAYCKCSRERVLKALSSFGADDLAGLRDADGRIAATCDFCAKSYVFEAYDMATPPEGGAQ